MLKLFETAFGSATGGKHRTPVLTFNQDSCAVHCTEQLLTLVTSDGISEASHSHLGSGLLVRWVTKLLHTYTDEELIDPATWKAIANQIAEQIKIVAGWDYEGLQDAVLKVWAATLGIAVLGANYTILAAFGNPRIYVNDKLYVFNDANVQLNQPASVAYLVAESTLPDTELEFKIVVLSTDDVQSVVVATDGIDDAFEAEGKRIAGGEGARVEPASYFWTNDEFFVNPDALTAYLNSLARSLRTPGDMILGGKLRDDTTVAAARRTHTHEE